MKMIFRDLYIFAPGEKCARRISFQDGVNIITSSKVDGTNRGKSVIMRSLYHALGADAIFEPKFDAKNKVFILYFLVDDQFYYIYRASNLYKVFDAQKHLLFSSTKANDLADKLKTIIHFSVMLPNRNDNILEITPPAYNYLPYFLDQDKYEGSKFKSFNYLEQYANYKNNVLFYHFGIYSKQYFNLIRQKEGIVKLISTQEQRLCILDEVLNDLVKKIGNTGYSKDIDALQRDLSNYRQHYSEIMQSLNFARQHLVNHRNALYDCEIALKELSKTEKVNVNDLKQLHINKCPQCGSTLNDPVPLKSRKYNMIEDIISIRNDIQISIHEHEEAIEKEEAQYKKLLNKLNEYEEMLRINTSEIDDILKYKGMCEIRDDVVIERSSIQQELYHNRKDLNGIEKSIKEYDTRKKQINERYYQLLIEAKIRFGLNEISDDKFKNISLNFEASGSDKYIATVIWYFTIIKLRNAFNPGAIQFPIVFDSPNNVENDEEKTNALIEYLLENSKLSPQFIMSGIGFESEHFKNISNKPNIIKISTPRFKLLKTEDYETYSPLLVELCNASDQMSD